MRIIKQYRLLIAVSVIIVIFFIWYTDYQMDLALELIKEGVQ